MKRKFAYIGISYFAGLFIASFLQSAQCIKLLILLFLCSALIFAGKREKLYNTAVVIFTAGLAIGVFGIYTYDIYLPVTDSIGQKQRYTGTVTEKSDPENDICHMTVIANINGKKAKVSIYANDADIIPGDVISFETVFEKFRNTTSFDVESYFKAKGVLLVGSAYEVSVLSRNYGFKNAVLDYRTQIGSVISKTLPLNEGGIITALFLGDKSKLTFKNISDMKTGGIMHMAAVSGLHLSIICGFIMSIISIFEIGKNKLFRAALLFCILIFFAIFYKFSLSVLRAAVMLFIVYCGELFGRKPDILNSLGISALLLTILTPYAARDIGFMLSLTGTFGIGYVAPIVTKAICGGKITSSITVKIIGSFTGTFCAMLCTLPVSLICLGGTSAVAPVTNVLATPLVTVCLFCCFILMLTGGAFSQPILFLCGLSAKMILKIVGFIGEFKFFYITAEYNFISVWAALSVILIFTVRAVFKSIYKTTICVFTAIVVAITAAAVSDFVYRTAVIDIISDGKAGAVILNDRGLCAVIMLNDSKGIVQKVDEYLQSMDVMDLNLLVAGQAAQSSIAAYRELLGSYSTDVVIMPPNISREFEGSVYEYIPQSITFGDYFLKIYDDYSVLSKDGFNVLLSENKTEISGDFGIAVYYDKSAAVHTKSAENGYYNFYINKNRIPQSENGINLSYGGVEGIYINKNNQIKLKRT